MPGYPNRKIAEEELKSAEKLNPGRWIGHSRHVAQACELIAARIPHLDSEKAYVLGLLHDIGRRQGAFGQKHIFAGYQYALSQKWETVARISLTHSFYFPDKLDWGASPYDGKPEEWAFIVKYLADIEYDDYDRLVRLCDALGNAEGFCIIEKRIVDVALRYGEMPGMIEKWRKMFDEKKYFEKYTGCSLYDLLPEIEKNL